MEADANSMNTAMTISLKMLKMKFTLNFNPNFYSDCLHPNPDSIPIPVVFWNQRQTLLFSAHLIPIQYDKKDL